MTLSSRLPSLLAIALPLLSCAGARSAPHTDSGQIRISVSRASVALRDVSEVTRMHVEISPAGVSQDLAYDPVTGEHVGTATVPSGTQTVTATAFAGSTPVATGAATIAVSKRGTAAVTIRLYDETAILPGQDHGPVVTSIAVSAADPMQADLIQVSAGAADPDGDELSYQWTQDCPGGTFGASSAASSTWLDPAVETCVLTVSVTSNGLSDAASITVDVQLATGELDVDLVFVPLPFIQSTTLLGSGSSCVIARDSPDATCRPAIAPGEIESIVIRFDPVPAGSDTSAALADDCGGASALASLDLEGGTATLSWTAPAAASSCLITARVTRELIYDAQTVAVVVGG
jgi:hypothetical protein